MMHKRVLLVGSTLGSATSGLLYLASYLRRAGIEAYCQLNDTNVNKALLKNNIERLLTRVDPSLVGVSIKWFPHIARGLEICKIIKELSPDTKIVLGGNTASYYWEKLIVYPDVDYIILGDGEAPLLNLCKTGSSPSNLVDIDSEYGDISYIENEKSTDVYLSHLNEIFVDDDDIKRCNNIFVYTGKRCNSNCFYCGGCATAMNRTFGASKPFFRDTEIVKNDLHEAKAYTKKILFDFDFEPGKMSQLDYFDEIFSDELKQLSAYFYFWKLPQPATVNLLAQKFSNLTISIDLASLSEGHRMRLQSTPDLGVKPQPKDKEIIELFELVENQTNATLDVNTILGMPMVTMQDLDENRNLAEKLINYKMLGEIQWGRLHAQPGAPILEKCEKYDMKLLARTFEDFLKFSRFNLDMEEYPDWRNLKYPYILYNDAKLFAATLMNYQEVNGILKKRVLEKDRGMLHT